MITISFVIPVFNEEKRVSKTFRALEKMKLPSDLVLEEVFFVNDGSNDRTEGLISKFKSEKKELNVRLISYGKNLGKGFAVRKGMFESKSDYTLFFDADIATPLEEINNFIPYMKAMNDVILGTRKNGKTTVVKHQPLYRELLGHIFTITARFILQVPVSDFTCGFKMFSRNAIKIIFPKCLINRWAYDAEVLYLANRHRLSIIECPVIWADDKRTKVVLWKIIPQTFLDLLYILWGHNIKNYFKIMPILR